jgi:hypothetical protein
MPHRNDPALSGAMHFSVLGTWSNYLTAGRPLDCPVNGRAGNLTDWSFYADP